MIDLTKRGTTVKVITSNNTEKNHQEALKLLRNFLKPKRDWLGRVRKDWTPPDMELRIIEERFIHAKIYVKDGYAVVGSANLTESGLWKNVEHIVIFEGEEAEQIVNDFETLYNLYHAEEIKEELGKAKIMEKLAGLLKKVKMKIVPKCPECGAKVSSEAKFCPNCGAKLQ